MWLKNLKPLLVATLSIILVIFSTSVFAQEQHGNADSAKKPFDPTTVIMHHVQDAHSFHFFTIGDFNAVIPLPVILYSPQKGLSVFLSSRFGHEGENTFDGYKLGESEKIIAVDPGVTVFDFSLTRNAVQMFLICGLFIIFMIKIARKYQKGIGVNTAPSGAQNFMEPIIIFLRENLAKENLGLRWERYTPFLLTTFFFILTNSLFGLVPGVANVTGNIAFTLLLGIVALVVMLAGTTSHFWKHLFWPPGVPIAVKFILAPIELAGELFMKPGALVIRLFANMVAGHIVILAFVSLIFIFGELSHVAGLSFSPFSIIFIIFDYFLEILIAFIQAFIFTVLLAIFTGQGFEGSDHDVAPGSHDGML